MEDQLSNQHALILDTYHPSLAIVLSAFLHSDLADSVKPALVSRDLCLKGAVLLQLALEVSGVTIAFISCHFQLLVDPSIHLKLYK